MELVMECKNFQNMMVFYHDGELDDSISNDFQNHLETCENCRILYNEFYSAYHFIGHDKITESNPFFYSRVITAIENETKNRTIFWPIAHKKLVAQFITYIIMGVFAIATGYYIANDRQLVVNEPVNMPDEQKDYQLFADSYQLNVSTDDIYIIKANEIEE